MMMQAQKTLPVTCQVHAAYHVTEDHACSWHLIMASAHTSSDHSRLDFNVSCDADYVPPQLHSPQAHSSHSVASDPSDAEEQQDSFPVDAEQQQQQPRLQGSSTQGEASGAAQGDPQQAMSASQQPHIGSQSRTVSGSFRSLSVERSMSADRVRASSGSGGLPDDMRLHHLQVSKACVYPSDAMWKASNMY